MGATSIEWTEHTINPLRARLGQATGHYCEKISPGCANCYASRLQPRFGMPQFQQQRKAGVEPFLDIAKLHQVLQRKKPTKFFWCDMTDMFGDWVPDDWIAACFGVMAATPQHVHQVLTKRADRLPRWFRWAADQGEQLLAQVNETPPGGSPIPAACAITANQRAELEIITGNHRRAAMKAPWPLPNLWLGVSAESQETFDERWAHLRRVPVAVRWFSIEPQLSAIDARGALAPAAIRDGFRQVTASFPSSAWPLPGHLGAPSADWFVIGGESGSRARPFDIAWGQQLIEQCEAAGVPAFMKQIGAQPLWNGTANPGDVWPTGTDMEDGGDGLWQIRLKGSAKGGAMFEWPENLRIRRSPQP